jgi:Icc-related predicted phosphoesterase
VRVAAISDTHGRQNWVMPPCDVFIHAGDMTGRGSLQETAMFAASLRERMNVPGGPQHAILVPGNHDECFEQMPGAVRGLFDSNVHILSGKSIVLDELCFYGSPWTPPFMNWYFMADEVRLAALYENMPASVDILITHGPPFGILDPGWKVTHAGSTSLADAVARRSIKHHVFGHLHAAGGQSVQQGDTTFYNVSACDEEYRLMNQPRMLEVNP